MALTNCKECNNQISTTAKTCPHCGHKPTNIINSIIDTTFNFIVIVIIAAIVLAFYLK